MLEEVKKHKIFVVGIGPGAADMITPEAQYILEQSDLIVGYTTYINLIRGRYPQKEFLSTPMREEEARCELCFQEAQQGRRVALVCSGDAGVYGLASLMLEIGKQYEDCKVEVVSGVTAALAGAAALGAPLNHDFCVISLSDHLTPWEWIERRLIAAAVGDFVIAIYNPASSERPNHLRRACELLIVNGVSPGRACGIAENIGRDLMRTDVMSLADLSETGVNMFTTVYIGNSMTEIVGNKLITPRGYVL